MVPLRMRSLGKDAACRELRYARIVIPVPVHVMNILLIDDHPLLRGGLRYLLRGFDANVEIDEAGNAEEALERVAASRYDLLLLDLKLPGLSGMEALAALRAAAPDTPLVVLSAEEDPRAIRAAIEAGAMGFIPKSAAPEALIEALRTVLADNVYLPPAALCAARGETAPTRAARSEARSRPPPRLTPRQMDVLRGVIMGKSNKLIARELEVSEGTVKAHLSAVFLILGAHNRTEAVYAAARLGLARG